MNRGARVGEIEVTLGERDVARCAGSSIASANSRPADDAQRAPARGAVFIRRNMSRGSINPGTSTVRELPLVPEFALAHPHVGCGRSATPGDDDA